RDTLGASTAGAVPRRSRTVLLAGDQGIGKTRTAEQCAAHARQEGAEVLWGRCHEGESLPAYWPWLQIIRAYGRVRDAVTLRSEMGAGAAALAQIVPELRERWPDLPEPEPLHPEQARFRFSDSVLLSLKGRARPLVLFLAAPRGAARVSPRLPPFAPGELGDTPLLILGLYRDLAPRTDDALAIALAEGVHEPVTRR